MTLKDAIIIVFVISILGCKKENDVKPSPFYKVSQNLYPFLFNSGSFWIYKKSDNSSIDSIIVTKVEKDTFEILPSGPGEGIQGEIEFYNIKYLCFPEQKIYSEQLFTGYISRGLINGGFTFLANGKIGEQFFNAEVLDVMESVNIENVTYHNVVKMRVNKDYYIENNYNLYYVDSIGVIKKEVINNDTISETWNLLRFKTVFIKIK